MESAAAAACRFVSLVVFVVVAVSVTGVDSKSFNITNSCVYTVWPAISSGAGSAAAVDTTALELAPGQWEIVPVPSVWSGRVWGRTLCSSTTDSSGRFTCVTGDCGSGKHDCAGGNAAPPVTLAEFTLDGSGGMDFYDVSLVDGFNLPLLVAPQGAAPGGGNCAPTGCAVDLNSACPDELRATMSGTGGAVACKSTCQAFGSPQYCCTGAYGNPDTCKPSAYSKLFKKACPLAVSYAYDGADSFFTCGGGGSNTGTYTVTFCPSTTSGSTPGTGNQPLINGSTTPYTGDSQVGAASQPSRIVLIVGVLSVVTAALGVLAAFLGVCKICRS